MNDLTTATPADSAPATVIPAVVEGPTNARAAANALSEWRAKQAAPAAAENTEKPTQPRVNGRFTSAPAAAESPLEGADAAADNQPPGELEQGTDPADEQPSIDPPRSWTKEEKEAFKLLPPEYQHSVAERERKREADIRRGQDEVATQSKALTAKEQAADQARQHHEAAAQNALQVLQQQQAAEFSDIRTHQDVQKLATDDPFRFAQWQARQMQIAAQTQEVEHLNRQREHEKTQTFKTWATEQDTKFEKQFPEFADKEKAGKVRERITSYLTQEVGVPADALPKLWETDLFRDAMWQRVVYDASRFHAAQQSAKQAVQKNIPPVQRPGTAPAKGAGLQEEIAAATSRLQNSTGIAALRAATDLQIARRKAARR